MSDTINVTFSTGDAIVVNFPLSAPGTPGLTGPTGPAGSAGSTGPTGVSYTGWSPVLNVYNVNSYTSVLQIQDWVGGTSNKPTTGVWLCSTGFTAILAQASNIVGPSGTSAYLHAATHNATGSDPVTLAQSQIVGLVTGLEARAYIVSPTLTGTPLAPTASLGTNNNQIATTAFVYANASIPAKLTLVGVWS